VEDYVIHYRTFIKQSTLHWNSKRSRLAKRLLLAALLENIMEINLKSMIEYIFSEVLF
jgi:hypothetical protein